MDFRDPKFQKIFIGVAAFLVVAYFWYGRVFKTQNQKLTQMTQEYSTMITNLKNVEMKSKSLEALKIEYEELLARYNEIEQLLPEVKQIPSFLVQLHTASSLTGTRIIKVKPRPITSENFYNVAAFEIEMTGTYHDFGKFVGYIANFPFIANLSDVDIKATAAANTGSAPSESNGPGIKEPKTTINASFVLSTYFVKEEERLQELAI
jgi:type IV pilus assembly protein PilO